MLLFTKYKCTWLTAISMSLSRCINCQDVGVQQSHAAFLKPWVAKALWMGRERLCLKLDLAKRMFSSSVLCLLI